MSILLIFLVVVAALLLLNAGRRRALKGGTRAFKRGLTRELREPGDEPE